MSNGGSPVLGPRQVPGAHLRLSAVTISVDPPAVAAPIADDRTVALLRRARRLGVSTFDVAEARFPQRAEKLIATAFPLSDPSLAVIVGRSAESLAKERTPRGEAISSQDLEAALEESLEQSRRRLAPAPVSIVDWTPETDRKRESTLGPGGSLSAGARTAGLLWVRRLPSSPAALPPTGTSPALFSGELSLLDPGLIPLFESANEKPGASLIARDVFSGGRLDGSRFSTGVALGSPGAPPVDLRRLHEEFDPILRLGFLTAAHRRTLAQAALQFALAWPWVTTAVIPLPTPENLDSVLEFGSRPPLTGDELCRLGLVK